MAKFELTEEQLEAVRRHEAKVLADPNAFQRIIDEFHTYDPPSPFEGPQCGETGKVLTPEEYRAKVASNKAKLRQLRAESS